MYFRRAAAEALGTFILVFAGTAAIVINDVSGGVVSHVGIALTFGLVVMAMIYSIGEVSGAHINPAVTIAFAIAKRFRWSEVPVFIASQCIGALAASVLVRLMFPHHPNLGATLPAFHWEQAFVMEVVLSFILMFVILSVSTGGQEKGNMAGAAVGGVVALEALFAGPISGASMNPARSLGPAVISGELEHLWIYLVATTLGMLLAVPACRLIQSDGCCSTLNTVLPAEPQNAEAKGPQPM